MKVKFNIAAINRCTEAEGPFKRLAIWFQGCDKRCEGCCNPALLDIKPAHILSLDEVMSVVANAKKELDIEGVTFLGGEPILQQGLAVLSQSIRAIGLGVILFTGRCVEELSKDLMESIDLIIDGEFEQDKRETVRNLIGSANQRIIFSTERYRQHGEWFYMSRSKSVEINVSNQLFVSGDVI